MMWINYTPTSGIIIQYTDASNIERTFSQNYISPIEAIKVIASLIHINNIKDVHCAGISYELNPAIQQELSTVYNTYHVNFNKEN